MIIYYISLVPALCVTLMRIAKRNVILFLSYNNLL